MGQIAETSSQVDITDDYRNEDDVCEDPTRESGVISSAVSGPSGVQPPVIAAIPI